MRYLTIIAGVALAAFLYDGCNSSNVNPVAPVSSESSSWSRLDSANTHALVNAFIQTGNNLLAGTESGVLVSRNGGVTWGTSNTGLPANTWVTCFAVIGSYVFAGSQGNGVFISSDNGATWISSNNGLTNKYVQAIAADGTDLYVGTYGGLWGTSGGGVFTSSNDGNDWVEANNGLLDSNVTALVVSGGTLFAGTGSAGIFATSDGGQRWYTANNGLSYNWGIQAITVYDSSILAISEDYGLFSSMDNGADWSAVNSPSQYLSSIAVGGTDIYVGSGNGVFISTNGGNSWAAFNTGLDDSLVSAVAVIGDYIYAGNYAQTEPVIYHGPLLDYGIWRHLLQ